ncbi:DUF4194 domain-containing protein [Arthrobacter sp. TES]|jgi:hypothetical protein|uniref:DUF4194 domain-containing protein n=1 Tax=Paenarthrobacter TaxID=1742992 RepID=UPI0003984C8E|nr:MULTISPECIES: DUF4194 domain-containing protein [Paenarthrobacter]AOY72353.1 hypothetical protein ARZXY2_2828 [Arthrobacter sp. ZXY-2]ERI37275.1 hypothetical protein M707_11860 [Arthrobacter sp. AK-YN10]QOI64041.1 DUF4194 domain-containing protein [Arthrobacter sp. TES]MCX8456459.1 DUF4194 domain-containing protein [Paenarthrobacter ureafaciens]MCY0972258.1 DUF4194 domain-containing protein [Paenarthrobacter ureafaciens]
MNTASETSSPEELPGIVTKLFKGVVYAETDEKVWQSLLALTSQVRDYVAVLGLNLILDESEGYAFLRSREDPEGTLPRLIPRRQLTFDVSLLLVLLRKRLLEFDTNSSELRLIMTEEELKDMVAVFLPESSNEARILDRLGTNIKKVVELGFLRKLRGETGTYEVARILKAYVDAQWLEEFDARLADYRESLTGSK